MRSGASGAKRRHGLSRRPAGPLHFVGARDRISFAGRRLGGRIDGLELAGRMLRLAPRAADENGLQRHGRRPQCWEVRSLESTSFSSVNDPIVTRTRSPRAIENSCGGTMPVPVMRNTPRGKSSSRPRYATSSSNGRFICAVRVSPVKIDRPARITSSTNGQVAKVVRLGEHDAGAERARPVVDLGLRQVQRVLALDVARRHVVARAEADDLAMRS